MDNTAIEKTADNIAAEFVGLLFAKSSNAPTMAETTVPTPKPTKAKTVKRLEPAVADKTADVEQITTVPTSELDKFPSHPFQVRNDEEMLRLVESVKEYGVLTPVTVRKKDSGRFELVSGHRRKHACELAGITELPVIAREMTAEQAIVVMADSNLRGRKSCPQKKRGHISSSWTHSRNRASARISLPSQWHGSLLAQKLRI